MSERYEAKHCPGTILWVVFDHETGDYVRSPSGKPTHLLPVDAYNLADDLNDAEDDEP